MEEVEKIRTSAMPTEEKIAKLELLLKEKQDDIKEIKKAIKDNVDLYKDEVEQEKKGQRKLV